MKNLSIIFLVMIITLGCNVSFNSSNSNSNSAVANNNRNSANTNRSSSDNTKFTEEYAVGVDLFGSDYNSFDLDEPKPELCKEACQKDPNCKAWTFVKTNVQGDKARCWVKDSVPAPKKDECCVSGVKTDNSNKTKETPKTENPKNVATDFPDLKFDGNPAAKILGKIQKMDGDPTSYGLGKLCFTYNVSSAMPYCQDVNPKQFSVTENGQFSILVEIAGDTEVQIFSEWENQETGEFYRAESNWIKLKAGQIISGINLNKWTKQ